LPLQPGRYPATPLVERLRTGAGRRALAIASALLIETLLLLLLLSLGAEKRSGKSEATIKVVDVRSPQIAEAAADPSSAEPAPRVDERPAPQQPVAQQPPTERPPSRPAVPLLPAPTQTQALPATRSVLPEPEARPPSFELPRNAAPAAPTGGRKVYGPPDRGGSSASRDSERVGTAPNGEPLYAAEWYREPEGRMLRAYLSTASGPGWGLIACRTVPDYRVEDCVGLDEYPEGSQIKRAVLAAAWEFRVRPARIGGRSQVGSWVRIRIEYNIQRR